MVYKVRADFDQLSRIILQFDNYADQLEEQYRCIQLQLDVLRDGAWQGEGARAFYYEMEEAILPAMQMQLYAVRATGHTLARSAQCLQEADEEAAGLFLISLMAAFAGMFAGGPLGLAFMLMSPPELMSKYMQLGWNSPAGYMEFIRDRLTYYKQGREILDLLDYIETGKIPTGGFALGFGLDIADYLLSEPFSWEGLAEKSTESIISFLISKNPVGLAVLGTNAAVQFTGNLSIDASTQWRDILHAGNTNDYSYQLMTRGIDNFDAVLNNADLGNVVEAGSRLFFDIYMEPVFRDGQAFLDNPNLTTMTELLNNTGIGILNPVNHFEIVGASADFIRDPSWNNFSTIIHQSADIMPFSPFANGVLDSFGDPEHMREIINDTGQLYQSTYDFGRGIVELPRAVDLYLGDLAFGTVHRGLDFLPNEGLRNEFQGAIEKFTDNRTSYISTMFPNYNAALMVSEQIDKVVPKDIKGAFSSFVGNFVPD